MKHYSYHFIHQAVPVVQVFLGPFVGGGEGVFACTEFDAIHSRACEFGEAEEKERERR